MIWSDVYVYGEDGRTLYVPEVEGIGIGELDLTEYDETMMREVLKNWLFIHEFQNWHYWHFKKEVKIVFHDHVAKELKTQL